MVSVDESPTPWKEGLRGDFKMGMPNETFSFAMMHAPPLSTTPLLTGVFLSGGEPKDARTGHGSADKYAIPVPTMSAGGISTIGMLPESKMMGWGLVTRR